MNPEETELLCLSERKHNFSKYPITEKETRMSYNNLIGREPNTTPLQLSAAIALSACKLKTNAHTFMQSYGEVVTAKHDNIHVTAQVNIRATTWVNTTVLQKDF